MAEPVDMNQLRKKFPPKKKPLDDSGKGPLHRKSTKAAVKAIAREYELKKAELQGSGAPVLRKGPLFYGIVILVLIIVGSLVLGGLKNGVSFSKQRIELKPLQARKSMNALSVALGRYKFHVGEFPTTEEGLKVLALKAYPKKGWDGPYVNHIVNDPWGNEYIYETRPEGGNPILYSKGPDGKMGTTDDVMPDQEAFSEPFRDTSWTNGWAPYRLRGIVVAPDAETKARIQKEIDKYKGK